MDEIEFSQKIEEIFIGCYLPAIGVLKTGGRLVHYTSAEAAFSIIKNQTVWLRDSRLMNDFSELQYGFGLLNNLWKADAGQRLKEWLDARRVGLGQKVEDHFNSFTDAIFRSTYMISLSHHGDDEDLYGRLSMWRAYGGTSGVALVLNNTTFLSETQTISVFGSPVLYLDAAGFEIIFLSWVERIVNHTDFLESLSEENLVFLIFATLRTFVLCTKHPAFREEQEWRVFYTHGVDDGSEWLEFDKLCVKGVPQTVVKMKLMDDPERGVNGVGIPTLINRIIVGPCEHPEVVAETMTQALKEAGADVGPNMVTNCFIPLRQS